MSKYFTEAEENIAMDVQVGPEEEVTAEVEEKEVEFNNPVAKAKKDPNTVCVGKTCKEGIDEFYVDAHDVEVYADLVNESMIDALNDIILCNEDAGMTAANLVVVVDENTASYVRNLEKHGAACVSFVNEAGVEDVSMDVQVGPNGEEMEVSEDPQEANPVDAVKRQYDSVVIAQQDDKFFMDVEDVQKCAELNCESVIATLNGIIEKHEDSGICAESVVVMVNEDTSDELIATMEAASVVMMESAKENNSIIKQVKKITNQFFKNNGVSNIHLTKFMVSSENRKFKKGTGDKIVLGIDTNTGMAQAMNGGSTIGQGRENARDVASACQVLKNNKDELIGMLNDALKDIKVKSIATEGGKMGATNIVYTMSKDVEEDKPAEE